MASDRKIRSEAENAARNLPKATIDDLKNINAIWPKVIRSVPTNYTACLRKSAPSVRPSDGRIVILFEDDTVLGLCGNDDFKESLDKAFEDIIGKTVEYELASDTQVKEKGEFYPPTSMFGMDVDVDDSEF